MKLHGNACTCPRSRRLLVQRVLEDGWRPAAAAEAAGCSTRTAYKWVSRYRAEGEAGLVDRCSAPQRVPRRTFEMAVARRRPKPGLIHHSDQGSQYVSLIFGERCREADIDISTGGTSALRQRVKFHRRSLRDVCELDGLRFDGYRHVDDWMPQRLVTATGPDPLPR